MKILQFLGIQPNNLTWEFGFKSQSLSIYSEVLIFINGVHTINLSAFDCLKTDSISSKAFGTEKVALTSLQRSSAWSNIAFPRECLFSAQKWDVQFHGSNSKNFSFIFKISWMVPFCVGVLFSQFLNKSILSRLSY